MMISCRNATELIDKRHAIGLTRMETVKVRLHTMMCDLCHRYEQQSQHLERFMKMELDTSAPKQIPSDKRVTSLIEKILSKK